MGIIIIYKKKCVAGQKPTPFFYTLTGYTFEHVEVVWIHIISIVLCMLALCDLNYEQLMPVSFSELVKYNGILNVTCS